MFADKIQLIVASKSKHTETRGDCPVIATRALSPKVPATKAEGLAVVAHKPFWASVSIHEDSQLVQPFNKLHRSSYGNELSVFTPSDSRIQAMAKGHNAMARIDAAGAKPAPGRTAADFFSALPLSPIQLHTGNPASRSSWLPVRRRQPMQCK